MIILTFLLVGLTAFIAYRLQQDQAPGDTGAAQGDSCTVGANQCSSGLFCDGGICEPKHGTGGGCTPGGELECSSNYCCPNGGCSSTGDATGCPTPTCTNDTQCSSEGQNLGCQGNNQPFRCFCTTVSCDGGGTRLAVNCSNPDTTCGGGTNNCPSGTTYGGTCGTGGCSQFEIPIYNCDPANGNTTVARCDASAGCNVGASSSAASSATGGACSISNPNARGSYIAIGSSCPANTASTNYYQVLVYIEPAAPGTTTETCSAAGSVAQADMTIQGAPGQTINPGSLGVACGNCVQVDMLAGEVPPGTTPGDGPYGSIIYTGDCTSSSSQVAYSCQSLTQTSPAIVANYPPTQTFVYTATYTCAGLDSNIALGVFAQGTTTPLVGAPTTVTPSSSNYNATTGVCTYNFTWTATGTTNGNYDVRLMNDGTPASIVSTPVSCMRGIAIDSGSTEQSTFNVTTVGGAVCETDADGGAHIDYTNTVRNVGTQSATLDFVRDNLPSAIDASSTTQVTGITPTATTRTADYIQWDVNAALAPNETRTFSYRVNLNATQLTALNNTYLASSVSIQYGDNDSTAQFDSNLLMTCLPNTGLFDEPGNLVILAGLVLILVGILINRYGIITNLLGITQFENGNQDSSVALLNRIVGNEEMAKARREREYQEKVLKDREQKRS